MSRGNDGQPIFRNDDDRIAFLAYLEKAVRRFGWVISAWVLMSNHFHIIIETPNRNLSKGMQWVKGSYAIRFNRRHKRRGHLFEGRFKAHLIEDGLYRAEALRYVVLNPVRAKMVERPEDYVWSSYRATAGLEAAPAWLDLKAALNLFDGAPVHYQEYVESKITSEERLWDNAINGMYLGSEEWAKTVRVVVESKPRSTDHPAKQRAVGRPKMPTIVAAVAKVAGRSVDEIRQTRGCATRMLVAWIGWHEGLVTLRTIAASLRLRSEGHISNLIRRCERAFSSDTTLLGHMDGAIAALRSR
jgi:REP element-mobilizing transposase RayT